VDQITCPQFVATSLVSSEANSRQIVHFSCAAVCSGSGGRVDFMGENFFCLIVGAIEAVVEPLNKL
jgi:hypothetical protein